MMKINSKYLPIKGHYFFFLGSVSPVLPFMVVVVRQLGIPVHLQGIIQAAVLLVTVVFKPFIAAAADKFSKMRKVIFLVILLLMVGCLFTIGFLPPMHRNKDFFLSGSLSFSNSVDSSTNRSNFKSSISSLLDNQAVKFLSFEKMSCVPKELWDCEMLSKDSEIYASSSRFLLEHSNKISSTSSGKSYIVENFYGSFEDNHPIKFHCRGGIYESEACYSLWSNGYFYLYLVLLTVGYVSFASANSITDAICVDLIGEKGNYGVQRAWGTIGWGLMGPISGLLIDRASGSYYMKDYTAAFAILLVLGSVDLLLSAVKLKVPRFSSETELLKSVGPLLKKPEFLLFLFFVILAGSFDGVVASYIFVLQEEMAVDNFFHRNMKLLQGLTLGVQCAIEAPFMFICGWFFNKVGASRLLSLVFFLYIIRLLSLALVGSFGPVWATLITELLNGPCYGLGYTAVVVHAGQLTPPGTSATVQSITNICYESLGYALAAFLGGLCYSWVGSTGIYYIFGALSVLTFFLHLLSVIWEERKIKAVNITESGQELPNNTEQNNRIKMVNEEMDGSEGRHSQLCHEIEDLMDGN